MAAANEKEKREDEKSSSRECRVCNKTFKHFGHLFNHMRKFHGDDMVHGEKKQQAGTDEDIETPAWRLSDAPENEVSLT